MSKMMKRTLSLVMSIMMVFTLFTLPAYAEEPNTEEEVLETGISEDLLNSAKETIGGWLDDLVKKIQDLEEQVDDLEDAQAKADLLDLIDTAEEKLADLKTLAADYLDGDTLAGFNDAVDAALEKCADLEELITDLDPADAKYFMNVALMAAEEAVGKIQDLINGEVTLQDLFLGAVSGVVEGVLFTYGKIAQAIINVANAYDEWLDGVQGDIADLQGKLDTMEPGQAKGYLNDFIDDVIEDLKDLQNLAAEIFLPEDLEDFNEVVDTIIEKCGDIQTAINSESFSDDDAKDVLTAVLNIAEAAVEKLQELPDLEPTAKEFKKALEDAVYNALIETAGAVQEIVEFVDDVILVKIQEAYQSMLDCATAKIQDIKAVLNTLTGEAAKAAILDIYQTIRDKVTELKDQVLLLIDLDDLQAKFLDLIDTATAKIDSLIDAVKEIKNIDAAAALKNVVNTVQSYLSVLKLVLPSVLKGMWDDVIEALGKIMTYIHVAYEELIGFTTHTPGSPVLVEKQDATCELPGYYLTVVYCTVCGKEVSRDVQTIPAKGHNYEDVITPATLTKDGAITPTCTICGDKGVATRINKVGSVTLSSTSVAYNGKVKRPTVTVLDSVGNAIDEAYYTVTYSDINSKAVGTYTVTVDFKDYYSGSKTLTYKINKAKNPLVVKPTKRTFNKSALKTAKTFQITVSKAQGTVKYTASTYAKKAGITVTSSGKVTVPKNCKRGSYKIVVRAAGNSNYKAGSKAVVVTVK